MFGVRCTLKQEYADGISLEIDSRVVFKSSKILAILGVTIDDNLTFRERVKEINKRAGQKVGVPLLRLRNLIPSLAKWSKTATL